MKKILVFGLALVMVFALVACTPSVPEAPENAETETEAAAPTDAETKAEAAAPTEAETETEEASKTNSTDFVIVTIPKATGLVWFQRMEEGINEFVAETGVDAYMTGPAECDAALQAQAIEDLIAQGVDAICVVPFSTEAMEPVLKKARDAGILVITHEAEGMTNIDYDIEAFDNAEYGAHLMAKLGELTGGEGEYIVTVGALTSASHNQWVDAGIAYQQENYPDMVQYGDRIESGDKQEGAYEKVKEVLKANPTLAGMQGSAMNDVTGAALAVIEAGLSGEVKLVGTSLVSVSGKYVKDGTIDMISFWDPAKAGYAMNALALKILQGDDAASIMDLGAEGYGNLTLDGKVFRGQAWIDVDATNVDDPEYNF